MATAILDTDFEKADTVLRLAAKSGARDTIARLIANERERCARIAEAHELEIINPGYVAARQDIAAAIRKSE